MVRYSRRRISELLHLIDTAEDKNLKGDALEDLVCLIFSKIPGIEFIKKDFFNKGRSQEIDIGFWNSRHPQGLNMIESIIIVECKNTTKRLDSKNTRWFIEKVRDKHQKYGVLVSLNGITGSAKGKTAAYQIIFQAYQRDGIMIFLITREELLSIKATDDIIKLIKQKYTTLIIEEEVV